MKSLLGRLRDRYSDVGKYAVGRRRRICQRRKRFIPNPRRKRKYAKILAYGKANNISYPAAEAANKYQPEGCASGSWCGAGNWYLPSNYQVFAYFDNRETILEMLEAINKLPDDWWYTRRDFYTITSNEIDDKQCGFIYINTGGMAGSSKQISVDQPDVILPFISY